LVSVGVVVIAAVVGVAVMPLVAEIVGAAVVAVVEPVVEPVVAPVVAAAVVPVVAPPETESRKMAASVVEPPVTTGVGCELMDAFTVASGFAYADGGMSWPVGGACVAMFGCGPEGLIVPRNRSR
jgi:hypothetical protein